MSVSSLARKPLYAPRGAVATSQPLAAAAGLAVLRRGGNAVDAAIATATTLAVVQPGSNEVGGDMFALVWDGSGLYGLNGSGRAPARLTYEIARAAAVDSSNMGAFGGAQARGRTLPLRGWLPVTVPGAPAGWRDLHARFGSLPFADLFVDAIGYAEHGFPVSPSVARHWDAAARATYPTLSGPEFAEWGRVYTFAGGRAPRPGETWRNPDIARTLRLIAESGAEEFYRGEIAAAIVGSARQTGGLLTAADLDGHTSTWVDPIGTSYRGFDVWELPPNGQGIATLAALNILEAVPDARSPGGRLHVVIEAMKLGFADAHAWVGDPDVVRVPVAELLDKGYAAERRKLIGEKAGDPPPGDPLQGGTVYLCSADSEGMMVSLIQSNYMAFGSYVVVPDHGFGLQNRGAGFSLERDHPNVVAPGKRPFHTIIPGFLTRDGAAVGAFGVMGGHMQPQGHVQVVLATVDDGLDPQAALNAPRWYWHTGRQVRVEPAFVETPEGRAIVEELRRRGHEIMPTDDHELFGYGQAIWRLAGGGYVVGSEPRADGAGYGY